MKRTELKNMIRESVQHYAKNTLNEWTDSFGINYYGNGDLDSSAPWNEEPTSDPSYGQIKRTFNTTPFIIAFLECYSDNVVDTNDLSKLPQEITFLAEYEYDEGFDGEDTYMENEKITSVQLLFNINGKEINFNDFIKQNQQSFNQNSILAFN